MALGQRAGEARPEMEKWDVNSEVEHEVAEVLQEEQGARREAR